MVPYALLFYWYLIHRPWHEGILMPPSGELSLSVEPTQADYNS
jgi:hypothetical protein